MAGILHLVATPIGNLGDLSQRAIETLKSVDVIACEDTRRTGLLLQRHQIRKPLTSFHEHNERSRTPALLDRLAEGQAVALVSDGGTPLINDPGWWLVRRAIDAGIAVSWVPGPVALIGALILSGLPTDRFVYEGFLPPKPGARRKRLEALKSEPRTVVCYESPHRLLKTLADIREIFGDAPIALARELTKQFEEVRRGTAGELLAHFERQPPRGEFVLVLGARPSESA